MSSSAPAHTPRRRRRGRLLIVGSVTALTLTGCNTGSSPRGELSENQQFLATCDPSAPPASLVQVDGTDSNNSGAIAEERMAAIESIVRETAVCSGRLRVAVFSVSSAAATLIFDGPLELEGATDNARLKKVPGLVSEVMRQIKKAYEPAIAALPPGGSDVTAMYRLAGEWIRQLGNSFKLHLYVFSDGIQTVGVNLGTQVLSDQAAVALARKFDVPQLPEASVVVAGLGRVADPPLPSPLVEGLIIFYDALCQRTGASHCLSVTDYSAGR